MTSVRIETLVLITLTGFGAAQCTADTGTAELPGSTADAAGSAATDTSAIVMELNGCKPDDYEDHTAASDTRVIAIARSGLTYSPKCMTISAGQSVRWEGNLSAHPLAPGNPSDQNAGSPKTPVRETSTGKSVEFRFTKSGTYPYYCTMHAFGTGQGMAGVIQVR